MEKTSQTSIIKTTNDIAWFDILKFKNDICSILTNNQVDIELINELLDKMISQAISENPSSSSKIDEENINAQDLDQNTIKLWTNIDVINSFVRDRCIEKLKDFYLKLVELHSKISDKDFSFKTSLSWFIEDLWIIIHDVAIHDWITKYEYINYNQINFSINQITQILDSDINEIISYWNWTFFDIQKYIKHLQSKIATYKKYVELKG